MSEKIRKYISLMFNMNISVLNKPIMQVSVLHTSTSMKEDVSDF